jgi:hypothetical protein
MCILCPDGRNLIGVTRSAGHRRALLLRRIPTTFFSESPPVINDAGNALLGRPRNPPLVIAPAIQAFPLGSVEQEICVVALVGLPVAGRKVRECALDRCGLTPLELPSPSDTSLLDTVVPEAVVLDCRHAELKRPSRALASILEVLESIRGRNPNVPLVVLGAPRMRDELRQTLLGAEAFILPPQFQTNRQIAVFVRALCGLPGDCCLVGERPNRSFTAPQSVRHTRVTDAQ